MTRVLSALVLLPIVVGTVWFLPPVATLVLALIAARAARSRSTAAIACALWRLDVPSGGAGAAVLGACASAGDSGWRGVR